jgi:hypothetical protein
MRENNDQPIKVDVFGYSIQFSSGYPKGQKPIASQLSQA